jgi:YHS domain-containing protein
MVRALLELILVMVVARSFWRVVGGILEGLGVQSRPPAPQPGAPDRSVPMARDPVCGTFVVPERAVCLDDGRQRVYFCSTTCRDTYRDTHRTEPSTRSSVHHPAPGRTA